MKRKCKGRGGQTAADLTGWKRVGAIALILLGGFCATPGALATDEKSIQGFREAIIKLAPTVDPAEADAVSTIAHHTSRQLKKEYAAVGPAVFQNFLINIGARQRGYCAHYARDIGTKLKELRLKTLYLHWGAADAGTRLEHNVIIVTAPNQDYRTGYIIDGWRNAGRLCWWPVLKDSSYVWKEDLQETAWLHDYELVQQKAPSQPKAALQSKPALQSKAKVEPRTPIRSKPETASASIEIKG